MKPFACLCLILAVMTSAADAADKRILLIAGRPSHGPGDHEFRAGVLLWQDALKSVQGISVEVHTNGWPTSDAVFEGADAVVIYADGGGGHPAMQEDRMALIDRLVEQGVGVGCAHYAVEVAPGAPQAAMLRWIGGAYEHEYSVNPMWTPVFDDLPPHPVTDGVDSFSLIDEWYFNMRWNDGRKGVTPILTDKPSDDVRDGPYVYPRGPFPHIVDASGETETMMWTFERENGGRGFGFTGGHKHVNWFDDNQRKLVLNAILWIAKADIPDGGVSSEVTIEQIAANLDRKRGADRIPQVSGKWNFEVTVDGNVGEPTMEFAQAGVNLVGSYQGMLGSQQLKGQANDGRVAWSIDVDFDGEPVSVRYEGALQEDGSMAGTVTFDSAQGVTQADWTATRVE